jgi:hypothetical protein
MSIVSGIDSTLLILGTGITVAICIAAGLAIKKIRATAKANHDKITADQIRILRCVQKIPIDTKGESNYHGTVIASTPRPKDTDCIHGRSNISESLRALAEKYFLDEITLATADGLLLASSHGTPAADDIARNCEIYNSNLRARPPGIILFGMEHKGSSLVGVAKTKDPFIQEPGQELICETIDILNWWI